MPDKSKLQAAYASHNNREVERQYDQWAGTYDVDIQREYGWPAPGLMARMCAKYVPKNGRILDAGAGTGLTGVALFEMGYGHIVGIDLSREMLEEARKKKVYRELHRMAMGETLDFPDDSFDAVVSVGALTIGHAPASSLDELVRITRPEGHVIFTLRPDFYQRGGFKEKHAALESQGKWRPVEVGRKFQAIPESEPDVYFRIWVYRIGP
ncbi:MAG: class I SAM-dependent methyltransferase [Dehalococcoidia bacterium]